MKPNNTFAFESIAYQASDFFDAMTEAVAKLRVTARGSRFTQLSGTPESKALCQVIKKFTNLTVSWAREDSSTPDFAIMIPRLRNGHVFDSILGFDDGTEYFVQDLRQLFKDNKNNFDKGTVDIRRNWVDGIFAKIPFELYVKSAHLRGDLYDDREIAAILLHETGHAFTQCEYMNRSVCTNQVLADLAAAKTNKDEHKITTILLKVSSEYHLNDAQKKALRAAKKPEDYVVLMYAIADEQSRSELGHSVYESTACEQLADQYATRCGAGRYLVTGLDKLMRDYGAYRWAWRSVRVAWSLFSFVLVGQILGLYVGLAFGATLMAGVIVGVALSVLLTVMATASAHDALRYALYDGIIERYDRVKHQMVNQLKDPALNKKIAAALLEDLAVVDGLVEPLREKNSDEVKDTFNHYLALLFNGSYVRRLKLEELQKELENLASNNLFVHAAKLRTI